jgi:hypothetical protein
MKKVSYINDGPENPVSYFLTSLSLPDKILPDGRYSWILKPTKSDLDNIKP